MTQHMPAKIWATYDGGEWSTARLSNDRLFIRADIAERMAVALAFYADPRRHNGPNQNPIEGDKFAKPDAAYILDVTRDHGEIARSALSAFRSATQDTEARHD